MVQQCVGRFELVLVVEIFYRASSVLCSIPSDGSCATSGGFPTIHLYCGAKACGALAPCLKALPAVTFHAQVKTGKGSGDDKLFSSRSEFVSTIHRRSDLLKTSYGNLQQRRPDPRSGTYTVHPVLGSIFMLCNTWAHDRHTRGLLTSPHTLDMQVLFG